MQCNLCMFQSPFRFPSRVGTSERYLGHREGLLISVHVRRTSYCAASDALPSCTCWPELLLLTVEYRYYGSTENRGLVAFLSVPPYGNRELLVPVIDEVSATFNGFDACNLGRDTHRWSCFYFELQRLRTSAVVLMLYYAANGQSSQDTYTRCSAQYTHVRVRDRERFQDKEPDRVWGTEDNKKSGDSPHHTSESIQILNPFVTSTRCRMEHRHNLPRQRFKVPVDVSMLLFLVQRVSTCSCAHNDSTPVNSI